MQITIEEVEYARKMYCELGQNLNKIASVLHRDPSALSRVMRKHGINTKGKDKKIMVCVCGHEYINYEMIDGRPICPGCWRSAWYSTPRNIKKPRKIFYKIRSQRTSQALLNGIELGLQDHGYIPDTGCKTAKMIFGRNITCKTCKFARCIEDLPPRTKIAEIGITDDDGELIEKREIELCRR